MNESVKWGKTFSLALVLVGLGLFAFWLETEHKPAKEKAADAEKRLLNLDKKAFSEIKIRNGKFEAAFKCQDLANKLCKSTDQSNWQMTSPTSVKADSANVNGFLSSIQSLEAAEVIELGAETTEKRAALLKEYGLDSTAIAQSTAKSLELVDSEGIRTILHFGEVNPLNDGFFVALATAEKDKAPVVNHQKVFVIPGYIRMNFDHDQTYWRDKKLLSYITSEIQFFDLKGPKGTVSGSRSGNLWTIHYTEKGKPASIPGDFENIEALLNAATLAQAQSFHTESELKGSALSLTLILKKLPTDEGVTLKVFTNPQSKTFAKVSGLDPVFGMDTGFLSRVNRGAIDLRRVKLITTMQRFGVSKVSAFGKSYEATDSKVQELLDKLAGNRIVQVAMDQHPGSANRKAEISLISKDSSPVIFTFWKSEQGKLYTLEGGIAYEIDPTLETSLPFDASFFQGTLKK